MEYLTALLGLLLGLACGYVLRREIKENTAGDPDRRLKELRHEHAACGDRSREMSLRIAQLESELETQLASRTAPAVDRPTYALDVPDHRQLEASVPMSSGDQESKGDEDRHVASLVSMSQLAMNIEAVEGSARRTGPGTPLTVLEGVGAISATRLESEGITCVEDMAELDPSRIKELVADLGSLGQRLQREDWVRAARREVENRTSTHAWAGDDVNTPT